MCGSIATASADSSELGGFTQKAGGLHGDARGFLESDLVWLMQILLLFVCPPFPVALLLFPSLPHRA